MGWSHCGQVGASGSSRASMSRHEASQGPSEILRSLTSRQEVDKARDKARDKGGGGVMPPRATKSFSSRLSCRPSRPVARWIRIIRALAAAMSSGRSGASPRRGRIYQPRATPCTVPRHEVLVHGNALTLIRKSAPTGPVHRSPGQRPGCGDAPFRGLKGHLNLSADR